MISITSTGTGHLITHTKAVNAIANLNDLFALGRRGIDGQMQAHLAGETWMGEEINARAFRELFRMVITGV